MSQIHPPFTYDGHGIDDAEGTRIAKVCIEGPCVGGERVLEFDRLSHLLAASASMLRAIDVTVVALRHVDLGSGRTIAEAHGMRNMLRMLELVSALANGKDVLDDCQIMTNQAENVPVIR